MSAGSRIARTVSATLIVILLYLLLWPVPIDPVAWEAPVDRGLVDPFGPDDRLRRARSVTLGDHEGPEDIVAGPDGHIYTGTSDGRIIRFTSEGPGVEVFADTGGRPLGLEFDVDGNPYVANAYIGLQMITPGGEVTSAQVLAFYEPLEYLPSERWFRQFFGVSKRDKLRLGYDIHGASGATISARVMTESVRRFLAIYQVLIEPARAAKPES